MEPNKCYRLVENQQNEGRNSIYSKKSTKGGVGNETQTNLNNPEILQKPLLSLINSNTA